MAELKQFEFFLLRYVPNIVRGEFVNIGVLLFEPQPNGFGFAEVRMTTDWRRATCLDKQIDLDVLQAIEADFRTRLQLPQDAGSWLLKLEDSFANLIQISPPQLCMAVEPTQELERLCTIYLKEPPMEVLPVANRKPGEHGLILTQIKNAFIRAGVWSLGFEHTSAATYTKKKNDPLFFDFGYLIGNEVRFFQAVPLTRNFNEALNIAYRFPKIAECIVEQTTANAQLTAVVADDLDRTRPDVEFVLDAFKDNHVTVARAAEMPSIADKARLDLNAAR